ncbi:MAG: radical SAM protein [Thermoplasmatales archaeon]|mgnify:CR=1 FL=1|nr:radical SAM protein [Thermoplasmatales archaeon]
MGEGFGFGSALSGPPAKGCEICAKGAKMVLFITGVCSSGCYYCPVSDDRRGKKAVFADEMRIGRLEEMFAEAEAIGAEGTGITGGDPLEDVGACVTAIRMLKDRYGKGHHIHLYTSTIDTDKAKALEEAGLDEIRFHPPVGLWKSMEKTQLETIVRNSKMDVGIEVPALPGLEAELDALLDYAEDVGVRFVNINELEFSEGNWDMMAERGYEPADDCSAAVLGSLEMAIAAMEGHPGLPIHVCSSSFKDGAQLRNRLIRRAERVALGMDVVTEDGTILRGIAYPEDPEGAMASLIEGYGVPTELVRVAGGRLEAAAWVLEELAAELPYRCYVVEEYPTADRLEVERVPLNRR